MDKARSLSTLMVGQSLDVKKDVFRPQEDDEETLGPEVSYLSAIGALMYLVNYTRPNIAFAVNLLVRYSSAPTWRHWNEIKHILRYFRGTTDLGLFYPNWSKPQLVGYADEVTFLIHTKVDHKQGIYLLMEILLFHGDLLSKQFLLLPQIMQRLSQFMKRVVSVFGWDR